MRSTSVPNSAFQTKKDRSHSTEIDPSVFIQFLGYLIKVVQPQGNLYQ